MFLGLVLLLDQLLEGGGLEDALHDVPGDDGIGQVTLSDRLRSVVCSWCQRSRTHHIRLTLQPCLIVDRHAILHLHRRLHPALRLLDHVPRLVRQMLLLARRHVNVAALRVSESVELRGPR